MKPTVQELKEALPNISEDNLRLNTVELVKTRSSDSPEWRTPKRSKYNAIPTTYNGVVYHSKKEATFAQKLDLMLKDHEINYVLRQVPFDLGAGITYRADFVTLKSVGIEVVYWDVTVYECKGMWTDTAKLKMKLFHDKYPLINLVIV